MAVSRASFGALLRELLRTSGITSAELARRLDRSPTTTSRWASDKRKPAPSEVIEIARALGVDEQPLLVASGYIDRQYTEIVRGYTIGEQVIPPELARLMELFPRGWQATVRTWDERDRKVAQGVIRGLLGDPPPRTERRATC